MARRTSRPQPTQTLELPALTRTCPVCGGSLWAAYKAQRSITTLDGTVRLRLQIRRCRQLDCSRYHLPLRPEQEGRFALPEHEFGLDVIALISTCASCLYKVSLTHMPALSATALSCRQINLAWVDNSNNESAYVVELSRDAGTTYKFKVVGSEDFTKLGAFQHIGQIGVSAHRGIPGIFPPLTKNP